VIAAALAGNAPVIVTGDRDLLKGEQLTEWLAERGIEVIRPVELLRRLDH
jgi:predicted nucleic acid-binding protein